MDLDSLQMSQLLAQHIKLLLFVCLFVPLNTATSYAANLRRKCVKVNSSCTRMQLYLVIVAGEQTFRSEQQGAGQP